MSADAYECMCYRECCCEETAAEIEGLRAEVERLRVALQACVDGMESCVRVGSASHVLIDGAAFRAAKANAIELLAEHDATGLTVTRIPPSQDDVWDVDAEADVDLDSYDDRLGKYDRAAAISDNEDNK